MRRTYRKHMCINIEWMLSQRNKLDGLLEDENGEPLSDFEVRLYLHECADKGWRVIPTGECDNFDYQTGCKGHGVELLVDDMEFEEGNG